MAKTLWTVASRLAVALVVFSTWLGVAFLLRDTSELPKVLREWRAVVPFTQTTALIWFSGFLALWVIWIDLRPLILPLVRRYFAGRWFRLFEPLWVQAQETPHEGPAGRLWELRCKVRFVRNCHAPVLNIRVRVCIGTNAERTILASSRVLPDIQRDETLTIRFGSVWMPEEGWVPHHSVWGEELVTSDPEGRSIVFGCKNVVEISVGRQRYRIFATTPTDIHQPWNRILLTINQDEAPALLSLLGTESGKPL